MPAAHQLKISLDRKKIPLEDRYAAKIFLLLLLTLYMLVELHNIVLVVCD